MGVAGYPWIVSAINVPKDVFWCVFYTKMAQFFHTAIYGLNCSCFHLQSACYGEGRCRGLKPRSQPPGAKNIIGAKVVAIRLQKKIKQKDFLAQLQTLGMDVSATSLSRLEGQHRLVQDYELVIIARALGVAVQDLLGQIS